MLKICDTAIAELVSIIFNNCRIGIMIRDIWEKSNMCSVHKKGKKQTNNNYGLESLLPICVKIFERLIFNFLYEYVEENKLLSVHPSVRLLV